MNRPIPLLAKQVWPGLIIVENEAGHHPRRIAVREVEYARWSCRKIHINGTLCYEPNCTLMVVWPDEVTFDAIRDRETRAEISPTEQGYESVPTRRERKQKKSRKARASDSYS